MNVEEACEHLNIPPDFLSNNIEYELKQAYLNKQYRKCALVTHPDKNGSSESFHKVKEAYDILSALDKDVSNSPFLENSELIDIILDKMFMICEKQIIKWLENVEMRKYKMAHKILIKYRHIFHLSDEFYLLLEQLDKRMAPVEYVIEPKFKDIMDNMIYSLWKDGKQYLIPLWHHELVYDHFGKDLVIKIEPVGPLWIDSENDVHCSKTYSLAYLFELSTQGKELEIYFGEKKVFLNTSELLLKQRQTYTWKNEGISKIKDNIYDSLERGDLILELTIVQ